MEHLYHYSPADDSLRGVLGDMQLLRGQSVLLQLVSDQVPMSYLHLLLLSVAWNDTVENSRRRTRDGIISYSTHLLTKIWHLYYPQCNLAINSLVHRLDISLKWPAEGDSMVVPIEASEEMTASQFITSVNILVYVSISSSSLLHYRMMFK